MHSAVWTSKFYSEELSSVSEVGQVVVVYSTRSKISIDYCISHTIDCGTDALQQVTTTMFSQQVERLLKIIDPKKKFPEGERSRENTKFKMERGSITVLDEVERE